jgi:hypothetical protein
MNGIYTNLAKKRAEQSKAPVNQASPPPPGDLVAQATPAPAPTTETGKPGNKDTRKPVSKETRKQGYVEPAMPGAQEFDLNIEPYKNGTFLFTYEELDAVDDLKKQLKRRLDLPATQYDIVRGAIHIIVEDYRQNGTASLIVQRIRQKKAR